MSLRLSVLDQSTVGEGYTAADALHQSIDLAQAVEELGYHRYWLAEHHHSQSLAGTAPEALAGLILERTTRMRVGSGGVLLPRYDPVKVAEVFQILAAVHPGRVDLGIGRAGGPAADFPERLVALHRALGITSETAARPDRPDLWLLGAGTGSAALAAELGTAFAFGHFLRPKPGLQALDDYRRNFTPVASRTRPHSALAVRVVAADTANGATALAETLLLWRSRKDLGRDIPVPHPDSAKGHRWSSEETNRRAPNSHKIFVGTPDILATQLTELAAMHNVNELIVNTPLAEPADRIRSYQLVADALAAGGVGRTAEQPLERTPRRG